MIPSHKNETHVSFGRKSVINIEIMFQYLIKVIGGIMTTVKSENLWHIKPVYDLFRKKKRRWPSSSAFSFGRNCHASYAVGLVLFIISRVGESAYNRQYRREHDANMPRGENFNLIWKTFKTHEVGEGTTCFRRTILPWNYFHYGCMRGKGSQPRILSYSCTLSTQSSDVSLSLPKNIKSLLKPALASLTKQPNGLQVSWDGGI